MSLSTGVRKVGTGHANPGGLEVRQGGELSGRIKPQGSVGGERAVRPEEGCGDLADHGGSREPCECVVGSSNGPSPHSC